MPLVAFSIASNARALERTLNDLEKKNLPFAASQAVNRLARQAMLDMQAKMAEVFDRPTPYTLNAFYWKKATRRSLTAEFYAKDFAGKGTPGWKYLSPETFGGTRRMKRFERALEARFGTGFATPGRGASLDQYGNLSSADVNRILSALGAFGEQGYRANRKELSARQAGARGDFGRYKKAQYFLGSVGHDGSMQAIYQIVGTGQVVPILVFPTKRPTYRARLPYHRTVAQTMQAHAPAFLAEEVQKAVATSKPV
jgi:hypothetical protein